MQGRDVWTIRPPVLRKPPGTPCGTCAVVRHAPVWAMALTPQSPHSAHGAVETCARYFQRELGYDFVQYSACEDYDPRETRAYLWTQACLRSETYRVLGACCLRWRVYTNLPAPCWALQWVWLHPYARRRGVLTALWPHLCDTHAPLLVEPPLSLAMQRFVDKAAQISWQTTEGRSVPLCVPDHEHRQEVTHA